MTGIGAGKLTAVLLVACLRLGMVPAQAQNSQNPANPSETAGSSSNKPAANDRVVIKVGGVQVTQEQFEAGFFNVGKQGGDFEAEEKSSPSDQDVRELGDNYASALMLSQKAIADHLDQTPDVKRELEMNRIQTLSNAAYDSMMKQAKPTADEIGKFYAAHASDYDQVRVRRLFIWKQHEGTKNGLTPEAATARVKEIQKAFASGDSPAKLAADLNNSDNGLLDAEPLTFPRGELPAKMEKVAFSLKEGEWAEVDDTPASLIFVQLIKHDQRPLEEVSSLIDKRLQGLKMQAMMKDLKAKSGVWMDKQYFATAGTPTPGAHDHDSDSGRERENH